MKHLQKLAEGFVAVADVNQLLREKALDAGPVSVRENIQKYRGLMDRARGLMMLVGGFELGQAHVMRINPKEKTFIGGNQAPWSVYVAVLYTEDGCLLTNADEAVEIHGGEYWWTATGEATGAMIINNSDDDCIVMLVEVRVDP